MRRAVRTAAGVAAVLFGAAALAAPPHPPPTLKIPGKPDATVAQASLLGADERDVRVENAAGDVTIYHGQALLDVLEKAGLDVRTMASERETAAAVVVATGRDGYTVVFSIGELAAARGNPRVFLVAEAGLEPLPEEQGPVRLIVHGEKARSAYGLATIELKYLARNSGKSSPKAPPKP